MGAGKAVLEGEETSSDKEALRPSHRGGSIRRFIPGLQRSRLSWEDPVCHSHVRDTFQILSRVQPFLVAKGFPGSAALKL